MDRRRLYGTIVGSAAIVYLEALWNRFAWDDLPIIYFNPLVHSAAGVWRAFAASYWPPALGGGLYRPLTLASYVLDWHLGREAWFHAVNLAWHAGASVAVAALARRWSGERAGLLAGLLFALHPVHVEAVANVVGRAELLAAVFALLAVFAALERQSVGWSAAALACALLSKENAAVVPALVAGAWALGIARPPRARMAAFLGSWIAVGVAYGAVRWAVLQPYAHDMSVAPVFVGATPVAVRLTAVAALADVARLLVFPLTLRVDYSPAERTLVTSVLDPRFAVGVLCLGAWAAMLWWAWRRGRTIEAFGLAWVAIALVPVANLLFPVGVLVAERTLYLPTVGLALAAGAWLRDLPRERWWALVGALVVAGGARTALRVPVWRDTNSVVLSEFQDSPRSFDGPARMVSIYLDHGQPAKAVDAFRVAVAIYDRSPWLLLQGADAAFALGRPAFADSLLARLERLCRHCRFYYRYEAGVARARGEPAVADSLLAHEL